MKPCKLVILAAVFVLHIKSLLADNDAWLAFGDLRGNIESCGCDPSTDLGGVSRLAAQLAMERRLRPDVLIFDLGNNLDPDSTNLTKQKFLIKALSGLKSSARLFNHREMALKHLLKEGEDFLLSNKNPTSSLKTKSFILEKNVLILGYFFNAHYQTDLVPYDQKLLATWQKIQKEQQAKTMILLFSGQETDLKQISKSQLFTTIIRSNPKPGPAFDPTEKENPNSLALRLNDSLSMQVPLAGVGILRGGSAQESAAQSLSAIFKELENTNSKTQEIKPGLLNEAKLVSWLTSDLQKESPLTDLMLSYEEEMAKEFTSNLKARHEANQKSNYIGSSSCKSCHNSASEIFAHSRHAKAFETLKKVGKQNNPECVRCHVVGFSQGGFVSESQTPELAGVGCETCHGPRKNHGLGQERGQEKAAASSVCQNCHINPHSSAFDFTKYWEKIKHR